MALENWNVTVVGILIGFLQAMVLLVLNGIRNDIKDIWKRIYHHYHEVKCPNSDCNAVRTGNVIVPGEGD
jgi:hypothetical protein